MKIWKEKLMLAGLAIIIAVLLYWAKVPLYIITVVVTGMSLLYHSSRGNY